MSASPPLKAVIFDFGGVLVRTRSQHLRSAWEQRLGLRPGEAAELVFGGERGFAAQHGHVTEDAHWQWLGEHLGLGAEDLASLRTDFFAEDILDPGLLAYVDRLRAAGLHLGLLSSAAGNARRAFGETYDVLSHFDSVTISSEEGIMKPDPRIFAIALARARAQPQEAVFVDDFLANVEGARRAGMLAIYFRTAEQATAELAALTGVAPLAAG
jgi:epoxide hydrolase-like predicted phosphatase